MKRLFIYGDFSQACHCQCLLSDAGIKCAILPHSDVSGAPMPGGEFVENFFHIAPGIHPSQAFSHETDSGRLTIPAPPDGCIAAEVNERRLHVLEMAHETDAANAVGLLNIYLGAYVVSASRWHCSQCGESVPGHLLSCWQCGEFHDEPLLD